MRGNTSQRNTARYNEQKQLSDDVTEVTYECKV